MLNKYYKNFKKEYLQYIKQNFQYIYIFRYNNLNIDENIFLKKELKKLKFNSLILKQNLIQNSIFIKIKGQGSIILIFGNNFNKNLLKNKFKFLNLICFFNNNKKQIFSNFKLNKFFSKKKNPLNLNILITRPFLKFLFCLIKINKANIT